MHEKTLSSAQRAGKMYDVPTAVMLSEHFSTSSCAVCTTVSKLCQQFQHLICVVQDVLHRVSTPSQLAGARPRYSLVWKLVFMPKGADQQCCIAKASWGAPTALGSAAKIQSIHRSMLLKRKAEGLQAELQA